MCIRDRHPGTGARPESRAPWCGPELRSSLRSWAEPSAEQKKPKDDTDEPEPCLLYTSQIKIEDAERADEAFSILMGEQVEPRNEFIERNAKYALLDV